MHTHNSLRAHSLRLLVTVVALGFSTLASVSHAQTTPISSWSVNAGNYTSGLNTSSPVLGDGQTAGSANSEQIYATIPTTYTLSIGDSITFSGNVSFTGLNAPSSDAFRFGIYDSNGSATAKNWLGYFASNAGQSPNYNGQLWERMAGNTGSFGQDGSPYAASLQSSAGTPASTASSTPFVDGNYTFSIEIERVSSTQVTIIWSLSNNTTNVYSVGGTLSNHTAVDQTFAFDRVGILTGTITADQIALSNLDVTYTASAIPEPATTALLMGAALSLALIIPLRRRLRATR